MLARLLGKPDLPTLDVALSGAGTLAGWNGRLSASLGDLGLIETDMTGALAEDFRKMALEQIPLGRYGQPAEVARIARFLVSEEAAYITGQVIQVDGGLAI